jgi:hypothetical protein
MATRRLATFRVEGEVIEGLPRARDRVAISLIEQVRRAVRQWLER